MKNPKLKVKKSRVGGWGVFVTEKIKKGELVEAFDGKILTAKDDFTSYELHHSIQIAPAKWRMPAGSAHLINHSCEPNCGIRNLVEVVAMRDIEPGEEITWDYEMTEDSTWWRMQCKCETESCRGIIGAYRNMPDKVRRKYTGYVSEWLVRKYHKID